MFNYSGGLLHNGALAAAAHVITSSLKRNVSERSVQDLDLDAKHGEEHVRAFVWTLLRPLLEKSGVPGVSQAEVTIVVCTIRLTPAEWMEPF